MSKAPKKTQAKAAASEHAVAPNYSPTTEERAAVHEYFARKSKKPPSPSMKVAKKGGKSEVSVNHPDPGTGYLLLMRTLGTTESDFAYGLLDQLAGASTRDGEANADSLNFMLAVVKSIAPRDEIEAMLAAQMGAVHSATMTFTRRLANVETIQQQDSTERALNKLARTFTTQMEALKRYRTGGEQKVTVEHVHVHEGGQAIVGHVDHKGEGGRAKKGGSTPCS